jgi:hypothetical protein
VNVLASKWCLLFDNSDQIAELDGMVSNANQLFALDDRAFVEAMFDSCCKRSPDTEELSFYLGELRSGRGKLAIVADLARFQACRDSIVSLPGLEGIVVAHKKSERWGFKGYFFGRRRVQRQLNRVENAIGRVLEQLSLANTDTQRRLENIEGMLAGLKDLTSMEPMSGHNADVPTANADAQEEVRARVTLTRSELASLSPVARQVLSEISLGLDRTSDSVSL